MNRYWQLLFIVNYVACSIYMPRAYGYGQLRDNDQQLSGDHTHELKRAKLLYEQALVLYTDPSKTERTIEVLSRAREILLRHDAKSRMAMDINLKLGVCYYDLGRFYEALDALRNAQRLRTKLSLPMDASYFDVCVTLGDIFQSLYQYDSAAHYYNYVEINLSDFKDLRPNERYRIYNALGTLNYSYGDNKLALNYFEKSLQECRKVFAPESQAIITVQTNVASSLLKLGRFREAIKRYQNLLPYQQSLPTLYQNLGKAYQELKQYDSSILYLHKSEQVASSDGLRIKLFNNMGISYAGLNDYTNALSFIDKAIDLNKKVYKTKNVALAFSHINKGKIFENQGQSAVALREFQEALILLHSDFDSNNIYHNPTDLTQIISPTYFFECLSYKAAIMTKLYNKTADLNDLKFSFKTYQLAIEVIDYIRKRYSSDETKLFFMNIVHPVYEAAIHTALTLFEKTNNEYFKEMAFSFSEKAKMGVLSDAVSGLELKNVKGIPSSLIRRELSVKKNITRLLAKYNDTRDSAQLSSLEKDLAQNEIELSIILKQLEANREYHKLKYNFKLLTPKEVQRHLPDNTLCIEYYQGGTYLFLFGITTSGVTALRIQRTEEYKHAIENLKASLYSFEEGARYQGHESAALLYRYLIMPLHHVLSRYQKILIIPDGELNYIPFEALTQHAASNRFMIYDYTINYAFSGSLLNATKHFSDEVKDHAAVVSMAPFSEIRRSQAGFRPLVASFREINSIQGTRYSHRQATKSKFITSANNYEIVHLATHARAINEDPLKSYIVFYPNGNESNFKLYMPEIYSLQLSNVQLLVISACEVGGGKFMNGEGIMSVSRAFTFAGVASTVTSLWKADDEISATIMTSMYSYLHKGLEKDEALRQAKLDYLQSNNSQRFKSPVFWANFSLVGDNAALYKRNNSFLYTLIVLFGIIFYTLLKRSSFNVSQSKQC